MGLTKTEDLISAESALMSGKKDRFNPELLFLSHTHTTDVDLLRLVV